MSAVVAALVALAWLAWPRRSGWLTSLTAGVRTPAGAPRPVPLASLASTVDLLAMALRSGCGVIEGMEAVARRSPDAAGAHLATVASALRWGVSDEQAWSTVPPEWAPVARALTLASKAGVPPAGLLARAAEDLRRAERARLELATARLGVTVVLPLGLAFLPAFILTSIVPVVIALSSDLLGG